MVRILLISKLEGAPALFPPPVMGSDRSFSGVGPV